jgi:hypothetical protein
MAIYEGDNSGIYTQSQIQHQNLSGYWLYTLTDGTALAVLSDLNGVVYARVITANPIAPSSPVGFISSSYNQGDMATVQTGGVCPGFSGLSPGSKYYCNGDGTVTAANTGQLAGVAKDATNLVIQ